MGDLKRISAWVDEATKEAFIQLARNQGNSESGLLGLLVKKVLSVNSPALAESEPDPDPPDTDKMEDRVTIRFLADEWRDLVDRARSRGVKRSAYLRNLFRSHVTEAPVFTDTELDVLREANHQLASLGRNVNQIAKALNISLDDSDLAKAFEYEEIKVLIDSHRETVKALIRANLRSWGPGTSEYPRPGQRVGNEGGRE